jgi:pyridoxal phosphate enzyme (YggS family)
MSHTGDIADNHKTDNIPSKIWGNVIPVSEELVRSNLFEIKNTIAPCKPKIIGVTKYFGLDAILSGYNVGLRDFGESRAQDAIKKIQSLPKEVRDNSTFHFIGHLQTNKADEVVEFFDYIHSVDSLKLAKTISKAACHLNKREKVLLQVNNAGEEQKFGYQKEQLKLELGEILNLDAIDVVGLMCMAPLGAGEQVLRGLFSDLREFKNELEEKFGVNLPELSMGMSDDYKVAVQEGSTMIRVGRKLFK